MQASYRRDIGEIYLRRTRLALDAALVAREPAQGQARARVHACYCLLTQGLADIHSFEPLVALLRGVWMGFGHLVTAHVVSRRHQNTSLPVPSVRYALFYSEAQELLPGHCAFSK